MKAVVVLVGCFVFVLAIGVANIGFADVSNDDVDWDKLAEGLAKILLFPAPISILLWMWVWLKKRLDEIEKKMDSQRENGNHSIDS